MLLQWCLKGIVEDQDFSDSEARAAVDRVGIASNWLRGRLRDALPDYPSLGHDCLSQAALDAHVNDYGNVGPVTPYISLSAGTTELDPMRSPVFFPALRTALSFATCQGTAAGYVFRLWVLVTPKPGPELPGFAEEVRDLNLFHQFARYHYEGEIAAKLYVPARQIETVTKYDSRLVPVWSEPYRNKLVFVPPGRVSNVVDTA